MKRMNWKKQQRKNIDSKWKLVILYLMTSSQRLSNLWNSSPKKEGSKMKNCKMYHTNIAPIYVVSPILHNSKTLDELFLLHPFLNNTNWFVLRSPFIQTELSIFLKPPLCFF